MVAQTDLETLYAQSRNRPEACSPVEAAPRQHPDLPTLDPRRCPTAAELDFTQPLRALRRFVDAGALPGRLPLTQRTPSGMVPTGPRYCSRAVPLKSRARLPQFFSQARRLRLTPHHVF